MAVLGVGFCFLTFASYPEKTNAADSYTPELGKWYYTGGPDLLGQSSLYAVGADSDKMPCDLQASNEHYHSNLPNDPNNSNLKDGTVSTREGTFEYAVVLTKSIKNESDVQYWTTLADPLAEPDWGLLRCTSSMGKFQCDSPERRGLVKEIQVVANWKKNANTFYTNTHTIVENKTDKPECEFYARKVASGSSQAANPQSGTSDTTLTSSPNDPNSITNYQVGQCVENPSGSTSMWQQLADGSWAPPGDSLNTCQGGGLTGNIFSQTGLGNNYSYLQNLGYYPWGTNYPGGYNNYSDYFLNCVLAQSIVARAECQAFPKIGDFYLNPYNSTNSLTVAAKIEGIPISAQIPLSEKVANVVKTVAMGWTLGQLFK